MSTKTSKKSSSVPRSSTSQSSQSTSSVSGTATSTPRSRPTSSSSPSSPLSPTRYTRMQEKQDLQNLNNRLACYIDKVRHLETENSRLTREAQTTREIVSHEVTSIKSMCEQELSEARKLLDETARERAKLEIDTKRLWDENEELKTKLEKKTKDAQIAERNLLLYETRCNDIQSQLSQALSERKRSAEREKELEAELNRLQELVQDTRKYLEEETLLRVDLENNIQSLKEDISFKDQIHQQELIETRSRRQLEISEIDGRLAEQYEAKLEQSLQEIRESYGAQIQASREELEILYENKIKSLQSQAQRNSGATNLAVDELRKITCEYEKVMQNLHEADAARKALNAQLRDLQNLRENERRQLEARLAALEAELSRVSDESAQQLKEYQDLMDIKIALDMEITAYRKLLETEEARLNIAPSEGVASSAGGRSSASRQTPLRIGKRKRTMLEESEERSSLDFSVTGTARGDVEISEVDADGRFVKLTNKGKKEITLGGWQIIRKAGDSETVFKFHRTAKIDAGGSVTVWSADVGATHEPPTNIVMKSQKWFVGDSMTTRLFNIEGEEMATSERKKQQISKSITRHTEELHYHQDDPRASETCRLM